MYEHTTLHLFSAHVVGMCIAMFIERGASMWYHIRIYKIVVWDRSFVRTL